MMNNQDKRGMAKAVTSITKTKREAEFLVPTTHAAVARHFLETRNGNGSK